MYFKVDFLAYNRSFTLYQVFPGGSDSKESTCNAGDLGSIPESGRSPGIGNGNPLQYSCLGNPWVGEIIRPQSMISQRAAHDWETNTHNKPEPQIRKLNRGPRLAYCLIFFPYALRFLFFLPHVLAIKLNTDKALVGTFLSIFKHWGWRSGKPMSLRGFYGLLMGW